MNPDEQKHKFSAVNLPPPAMGGAPNFVVAVIGNKLAGTPPMFVTGAMLCVRCHPKQVPAFHIMDGVSVCVECLEKEKAAQALVAKQFAEDCKPGQVVQP
jgi:hypothetical protein